MVLDARVHSRDTQGVQEMIIKLGSGLGDLLQQVFMTDINLCLLNPPDNGRYFSYPPNNVTYPIQLEIYTHNPYSGELFANYPTLGKLFGYTIHANTLNADPNYGYTIREEIPEFYPPDSDVAGLWSVPADYIVFQVSASDSKREIPAPIVYQLLQACIARGLTPVIIGRNYEHIDRQERFTGFEMEGVINLIDKLSVPGTLELVKRAKGIVTGHTSMSMAAWITHTPQLLLYTENEKNGHFRERTHWAIGQDNPDTFHGLFEDWGGLAYGFFKYIGYPAESLPYNGQSVSRETNANYNDLIFNQIRALEKRVEWLEHKAKGH